MMRATMQMMALGLTMTLATPAFAWDKVTTGKVYNIQILSNGNLNFWLEGNKDLCSMGSGGTSIVGQIVVGTLGVTTDGLRALNAALTAAMLAGKNVTVYANNGVAGGWGCAVGAIDFTNVN